MSRRATGRQRCACAKRSASPPRKTSSERSVAAPGFDAISRLVHEWQPGQLVIGLPVAANGEHPLAKRVERFARQLEGRFRLPVARVDERFSSVEAESRLRGVKHKAVDSVAAQLILEQYFDQAA